jgi:hypothetical protein
MAKRKKRELSQMGPFPATLETTLGTGKTEKLNLKAASNYGTFKPRDAAEDRPLSDNDAELTGPGKAYSSRKS